MSTVLVIIAGVVAAVLLVLFVATLLVGHSRIWPKPGSGSWQGYVFWPLFRALNVLCFAVAMTAPANALGLPAWLRIIAAALLAVSIGLFVYSFRVLGRDNSNCARDGLVTGGIYRWSRNPQHAMLVVVYGCLAFAADSALAYLLCAAMMAVYTLMVLAEEPWLEAAYGEPYRLYCSRVPRFFNWARAGRVARALGRRLQRQLLAGTFPRDRHAAIGATGLASRTHSGTPAATTSIDRAGR